MRHICLYNLEQAALILLQPTGITLFNQTSSDAYLRQEAEGCLVPLSNDPLPDAEPETFLDRQLAASCRGLSTLTIAVADLLDEALLTLSSTDMITVDRQRLAQSAPGWVYVNARSEGEFSQFEGFNQQDDGECQAILTWPNKLNL
jgi:uncharacterized protein DUF6210